MQQLLAVSSREQLLRHLLLALRGTAMVGLLHANPQQAVNLALWQMLQQQIHARAAATAGGTAAASAGGLVAAAAGN
jgi:hypothetical protein